MTSRYISYSPRHPPPYTPLTPRPLPSLLHQPLRQPSHNLGPQNLPPKPLLLQQLQIPQRRPRIRQVFQVRRVGEILQVLEIGDEGGVLEIFLRGEVLEVEG
jgi:hypothetical protein